jgi:hypothetical protein
LINKYDHSHQKYTSFAGLLFWVLVGLLVLIGWPFGAVWAKKYALLVVFHNKYPLQRDIFCCSEALLLMCEALLLFGWLGFFI